jgi:accessory colonization factor AcfC
MNFKLWFVLSETLDALTKGALEKYQAPPDELAAFIKELEDNPNLIDRKAAFAKLAERFPPTKQKPVKQEDGRIKLYKDKLDANQITKPEFDTFMLFIGENNKELVTQAMNLLRRFIENDIITLEVKNNKIYITKDNETKEFNDFTRFESELHSIEGSLTQYKQKSGVFNPIMGEKKYRNNLAAKGENVWVFRGDTPELCRIFGKNQKWCISSSTSAIHWFDYRINFSQTQYFVFDFNKDENDPARYVNPGVAPQGMSSEWVDAKNSHTTDSEDKNSDFGVNGYTSINQYKRYLASKGIPESIWTTTEPEDWEKRLQNLTIRERFEDAKKDSDPRVFPMYLRIVDRIPNRHFNTLTDEQKKEFVFGKLNPLTPEQVQFAKDTSGYLNSLDIMDKIKLAVRHIFIFDEKGEPIIDPRNEELILKLSENPNLDSGAMKLLIGSETVYEGESSLKMKVIKNIIKYSINSLDSSDSPYIVYDMLYSSKIDELIDVNEISEFIINTKQKLYDHDIYYLMLMGSSISVGYQRLAKMIIKRLGKDINEFNIDQLLKHSKVTNRLEIAELIVNAKQDLSVSEIDIIMHIPTMSSSDRCKLAELIVNKKDHINPVSTVYFVESDQEHNDKIAEIIITKEKYLGDAGIYVLIAIPHFRKTKLAKIMIQNNVKLSDKNMFHLINSINVQNSDDKDETKQLLKNYYKGRDPEVISLLDQ